MNYFLHLGDCYQILPTLDLSKYDRIVFACDPPYEVQSGGSDREYFKCLHSDGLSTGFDFSVFDLVPQAGAVLTFCSKPQRLKLETWLATRFHRVEELRWNKLNSAPWFNKCYPTDFEPWLHAWKEGFHPVGDYDDLRTHISTKAGGKSGLGHPTVKPLQVMRKAMRPLRGVELVIDPFMGTGTTGVVCQEMGIDFIGIEINEIYFETAKQRLEKGVDTLFKI